MISQFLDRITAAFRQDFLFASLLPALLASVVVVATFAAVVGIGEAWVWIEDLRKPQQAGYAAAAGLMLVVFAYLLHALRVPFRLFWSGQVHLFGLLWGPLRLGVAYQRWRYRRLLLRSRALPVWASLLEDLRNRIDRCRRHDTWKPTDLERLKESVARMGRRKDLMSIRQRLEELIATCEKCGLPPELDRLVASADARLKEWSYEEASRRNQALSDLDRSFGNATGISPTALGNVVASYQRYSYTRYRIESELFWPRLVEQLSEELQARIEDRTVLLDFALTSATLAWAYALAAMVAGPRLWSAPGVWSMVGLIAGITGYLFYRLGVSAAWQLGQLVRSSFDLYRLKLLESFGLPRPESFHDELETWQKLSALVVYGIHGPGLGDIDYRLRTNGVAR